MPKFNLYSAWMDPYFYAWAAVFASALFSMVYSIRRYLELKNAADFGEAGETGAEDPLALADAGEAEAPVLTAEQPELPAARQEPEPQPEPQAEPEAVPEPEPEHVPAQAVQDLSRAENFVHGIYAGISDLDERMKGIESALSKGHINNDFTVKFLEDIVQDIDTLDKVKIKARIEYLLTDLKK